MTRAMDKAVKEIIVLIDVAMRKYKFILSGLYVKYRYQSIVCNNTIPPIIPVTGRTVFTRSLDVSVFPTSCDKRYATVHINPISRPPSIVTSVDPRCVSIYRYIEIKINLANLVVCLLYEGRFQVSAELT